MIFQKGTGIAQKGLEMNFRGLLWSFIAWIKVV